MVPSVPVQPPTEQFSSGQPLAFPQQMVQDQSIDIVSCFFRVGVCTRSRGLGTLLLGDVFCSLRVAVPTPRGKMGGRERLRKTDTNCVL